jgi:gamma-tubulin complex component 3
MMAHVGGDEQGWDVFSLEYTVTPPLTTVFTEAAMGKYLRVFNFLWRLKRVEHSLCATWQTMKPNVTAALERDGVAGSAGRALADELRRCHTLRGEMHHFIANLQYYVMFEVLEGSWEVFTREMDDAKDLDSLIAAHDRYLDTILQKALLGPKSQLLTHTLGTLFEVILRFRGFADRLYEVARDAAMRRQLAQLRVEQRANESKWGSLPGEDAAGGDGLLSDEFVEEMRLQLDAVSADYAKMLDGFLNLLPLQTHVDLKFLLFRLDFSEYYATQHIGPSNNNSNISNNNNNNTVTRSNHPF